MKKLKLLLVLLAGMFIGLTVSAQEAEKELTWYEKGKVEGKVFANFKTMLIDDLGKESAFELNRAYLGYSQKIDEHFSAKLLLDIYKDAALEKRTAFFKNAYVEYKTGKFKVQTGIAGNFQFKTQEKFFGYRYVVKSFQDMYKFGPSADLGIFAYYKASDMLTLNFSVNNGEGYGVVQDKASNNFKTAAGVVITPGDVLTVSLYGDAKSFSDTMQMTLSGFVGAEIDILKLGVEYVLQTNHDLKEGHDYAGLSAFAKIEATDKINLFGRFDMVTSAEIEDATGTKVAWNLDSDGKIKSNNDGMHLVGGIEYLVSKNVSLAFDYQHQMYAKEGADAKGYAFVHMMAKF